MGMIGGSSFYSSQTESAVKMEPAGQSFRTNDHLSPYGSQDLMQPQHRIQYATHNHAQMLQNQSHIQHTEVQPRVMSQYHSPVNYSHAQAPMSMYTTRLSDTSYAVPAVGQQANDMMVPQSSQIQLTIRQHPSESLVVSEGKEKCRKPIDPPPVVEITLGSDADPQSNYLQNPYYFMIATVVEATTGEDVVSENKRPVLMGSTTSSLHRLKDAANKDLDADSDLADGGFFVYGDISCKRVGTYRMRFSLYEMVGPNASHGPNRRAKTHMTFLKEIQSKEFKVVTAKEWRGLAESTSLSRAFSDQGCRLRLRKEPRNPAKNGKRSRDPSDSSRAGPVQPAVNYGRGSETNDTAEQGNQRKRGRSELEEDTSATYDHHYNNEHAQWRPSSVAYPHSYHTHTSVAGPSSSQALSVRMPTAPVHLSTSIDSSLHTDAFPTLNSQPVYGNFT